jgi:hypothetical protein
LHLSVVGWPIDGAGDELQMGTRGLLSECYFPEPEHVHDITEFPRSAGRAPWWEPVTDLEKQADVARHANRRVVALVLDGRRCHGFGRLSDVFALRHLINTAVVAPAGDRGDRGWGFHIQDGHVTKRSPLAIPATSLF